MAGSRVSCGIEILCVPDINQALDRACKFGYDFISVPIVNPRFKREFCGGPAKFRKGALTRSDLCVSSNDWASLVVARISPWINLDSQVEAIRKNSEKAFYQELHFASHLSVPAIMVELQGPHNLNLARMLNDHILSGHNHQFWVRVPITSKEDDVEDCCEEGQGDMGELGGERLKKHDTWKWWNTLRTACDSHKKMGVALELTADLPDPDVIDRWFGEPIKVVIVPTQIFLTNKKGFPVLSRAHQAVIRRFFKLDVQLILSGADRHPDKGLRTYQQYLDHVCQPQETPDSLAVFAKNYEDYLQSPLQPLKDNLESQTYEVFEKDPVKYTQYQRAVYLALLDKVSEEEKNTKVITLMVLGAGRGPLVRASLNAAAKAERLVNVYAIEKNPNAVITLENMKHEMWGDKVTVVSTDMREWEAPEKADIIVSELLGSFGDNELSPECLDGAQKLLKDDGISIPYKYTSYLAPLMSSKLWNEAKSCKEPNKGPEASFETPYVVHLRNCMLLCDTKPVFTFHHPQDNFDNNRYTTLEFEVKWDCVVHGFGGYFDTYLYGDVFLSIEPSNHSPGMLSWFPMYFPIRDPFFMRAGTKLVVHFWRRNNQKDIWYEWCISEPEPHPIHNPKGRSYSIGL